MKLFDLFFTVAAIAGTAATGPDDEETCSSVDHACSSSESASYLPPTPAVLLKNYTARGFVSGLQVATEAEMSAWRRGFDRLEASFPDGRIPKMDRMHFKYRPFAELVTTDGLLDAVEVLLGPDLVLLSTSLFCKYPAGGAEEPKPYIGWHQDLKYWGLKSAADEDDDGASVKEATVWIAVDEATEKNGAMRFVSGSHRAGLMEHVKSAGGGSSANILRDKQDMTLTPEQEDAVVVNTLRPGQCSIHDGLVIHGSPANLSRGSRRCGLAARFVTPATHMGEPTYVNKFEVEFRVPVLVRGRDAVGKLVYTKTKEQMLEEAEEIE